MVAEQNQWWFQFFAVLFKVLSIREHTVVVQSCSDEPYSYPLNIHEFPLSAVEFVNATPIWEA